MEQKPPKITAAFSFQTTGIFILLIIILSFTAGKIRGEYVLTLTGAVFLSIWLYCLAMTLLLALLQYRAASKVSVILSPRKIPCAEQISVNCAFPGFKRIFQLPGILVRCRVLLFTKDGRRVSHDFKPHGGSQTSFQITKRGAYFTNYDEWAVFDALGFFRFAWRLHDNRERGEARLLVSPFAAPESIPVRARGGDSDRKDVPLRSDDFSGHRPYVPGDDPRRINWKLYGHGGEMFIRQGEYEPPPHSNITILIDTQYEPPRRGNFALKLSQKCTGRERTADAVDMLCENAIAILNSAGMNRDVRTGFTGQQTDEISLTPVEPEYSLAYPWAMPVYYPADLPEAPPGHAVVILALPRIASIPSALDRWLANNAARGCTDSQVELIFIYDSNDEKSAAEAAACVSAYSKRPGVNACGMYTCSMHTAEGARR